MHIVTVDEMRDLEVRAEREYGLTSHILMENAGKSAAEILVEYMSKQHSKSRREVHEMLGLVGPGNNGGDGLVMARHLEQWGAHISTYHWKEQLLTVNGRELPQEETAQELEEIIQRADYIIDALLGTGRSRPLPDDMRSLLKRVAEERQRRRNLRIVAMDLPTGLNADTGEVDPGTIPVDATITLACPKQGFFFFPGRNYIGELHVGSIGLPPELESHLKTEMLTGQLVNSVLPKRPLNSNKGTFGKVMLFCGSPPYPGSAFLAGNAAGRIGAGLVTLAVSEQMLPIYASAFHETTFVLLPEEEAGSFECVSTLKSHLELSRSKAQEWQVTLVLKGACTLVTDPYGRTRINWQANPALATAGTGDVLAGMIAGLLAQKVDPFDAASAAVHLHAVASELVSAQIGDTGLLASDLLPQIPRAIMRLRS